MNQDVIAQARAALPLWVSWAPLVFIPLVAGLLSWLLARVSVRLATPRYKAPPVTEAIPAAGAAPFREPFTDTSVHWMERARLAWGPRALAAANLLLLPLVFGATSILFHGPLSRGGGVALPLVTAAAAFVGPFLVRVRHENRLRHVDWSHGFWLRSHVTTALALGPHAILALAVGLAMPDRFGVRAWATVAMAAPFFVALSLGGGVAVAKALGLVRPASERLRRVVERAVARTGRKPAEVLVAPLAVANVYTYPAYGRVMVTDALLDALDDDGVAAMMGHGLAHLTESVGRSVARGLASMVVFLPFMMLRAFTHAGVLAFYGALMGSLVVAAVINRKLRYDFKGADKVARESEGDSGTYARALAKVYEVNVVPAVLGQKNPARPHLYDRMVEAGMTPDIPRPEAPKMGRSVAVMLLAALAAGAAMGALHIAVISARPSTELEQRVNVALTGGRGDALGDLALAAWRRGDTNASVALYRAAAEAHRGSVYLPANLTIVLANAGRCREASDVYAQASARLARQQMRESLPDAEGESAIVQSASDALQRCFESQRGDFSLMRTPDGSPRTPPEE